MRNRAVVAASPLLFTLVVVIAGMTVAGCEKRTAGKSEKQTAANQDRQTATDANRQAAAGTEHQQAAAGETQKSAGSGQQTFPGNEQQTVGATQAAADAAGKAVAPAKEAGSFKYVGVAACSMCHKGTAKGSIYEGWLATPHAKAFENLGAENQKNEVCLACHTTGYGEPLAANVAPQKMLNVQCEACHGPGSEYKMMAVMKNRPEALKKGLVLPTKELCLGCHGGRFPGGHPTVAFNYENALLKIEHHTKPTEPTK